MQVIGGGAAIAELETRPMRAARGIDIHNLAHSSGGFDAASYERRSAHWRPQGGTANNAMLGALPIIRDRARSEVRNDPYAKSAVRKQTTNIIGTGIKPLSKITDPALRQQVHAKFERWTDEADADGQCDFYGLQTLGCNAWLEGGEVFAWMRPRLLSDGLTVPLQIQLLEPEFCPTAYTTVAPNGNRVRAGIEFDVIGRRIAYYFYKLRPELDDIDYSTLVRVPGQYVAHVFDVVRPGQLRGLPSLATILMSLWTVDRFRDAHLERQLLANLFVAFLKRPAQVDGDLDPVTGLPRDTSTLPLPVLNPGIFQELNNGESIEWSEPPDAGQNLAEYLRQETRAIAIGAEIPYEVLTGDMKDVNDRTVRVILNEYRRRVSAWQHQVWAFQFNRPIFRAWMNAAHDYGVLPFPAAFARDPEPFLEVKWVPQGFPYIHPVQDVEAAERANRSGLKSRTGLVSEQGDDAEVIDAEIAADNARADKLGLKLDSDSRYERQPKAPLNDGGDPAQPAGAAA